MRESVFWATIFVKSDYLADLFDLIKSDMYPIGTWIIFDALTSVITYVKSLLSPGGKVYTLLSWEGAGAKVTKVF